MSFCTIGWCRRPCSTWRGATRSVSAWARPPAGIGSTQAEINALLIEHASQGKRVVRLKGGDPFIFGRGGEELEALQKARIRFSVIPGITAAAGCAAYAGIPLTHRDHAHSVTFVTGHEDGDGREPDYQALAKPGITAVFYMGLARVAHIAAKFVQHGAPETLPAALIAQGTLENQRVITGTLATIAEAAAPRRASSRRRFWWWVRSCHCTTRWRGSTRARRSKFRSRPNGATSRRSPRQSRARRSRLC